MQDYTNEGATGKVTKGVPIKGVYFSGVNTVTVASNAKRVYVRVPRFQLSLEHSLTLLLAACRSSVPRVRSSLSLAPSRVQELTPRLAGSCSDFDFAGLKTSGGSAGSITNVSVKVRTLSLISYERELTLRRAELLALSESSSSPSPPSSSSLPATLPLFFLIVTRLQSDPAGPTFSASFKREEALARSDLLKLRLLFGSSPGEHSIMSEGDPRSRIKLLGLGREHLAVAVGPAAT